MTTCQRSSYEDYKTLSEIETSSEPVRTSNYVKYVDLQHEPGMLYNAHEWLVRLLANMYPNINDCIFKIISGVLLLILFDNRVMLSIYHEGGIVIHQELM